MLHLRTEPSTPLRPTTAPHDFANFSAPLRSRLSNIHLPPQELSDVISGMSLRRVSADPLRPTSGRRLAPSLSKVASRTQTPTRRLSGNLTVRRRRRSSAGIVYDAGYAGPVTREFLRAFSRALVYDKKRLSPEDDNDEMYKALDEQHRLQSVSPNDGGTMSLVRHLEPSASINLLNSAQSLPNEFDYSLPLPSAPNSPVSLTVGVTVEEPYHSIKPTFKSYLERILESRSKPAHENELQRTAVNVLHPEEPVGHDFNAVINASQFVIENTLSSLPEYGGSRNMSILELQLQEPVAFGTLRDSSPSNDSSEKENHPVDSPSIAQHLQPSSSHETPLNTGEFGFDDLKAMEIPPWDSVLFYTSKMLTPQELVSKDIPDIPDQDLGSDLSQNGMILGHFTIGNEDVGELEHFQLKPALAEEDIGTADSDSNWMSPGEITPPGQSITDSTSKSATGLVIPKSFVKSSVTLAQRIRKSHDGHSPPKKRVKQNRLSASAVQLVTAKSNEFLQQLMVDLEAYAGHRQSNKINIQDALLYLNRIRPTANVSEIEVVSRLANRILPLEALIALDNSLQTSADRNIPKRDMSNDALDSSSTLRDSDAIMSDSD